LKALRYIWLGALVALLVMSGCRKRFDYIPSAGDFAVSTDTLFLDSVFAGLSSPTYYFKIYNTSDKNISIPSLGLARGEESPFRLNVDGMPGKVFSQVEIPAHDSIYVFVELTADTASLTDPVYEEAVYINDEAVNKQVLLAAFVKDAWFLYPQRFDNHRVDSITIAQTADGTPIQVAGFLISDDTVLTAGKAIVIYGHLGVPEGKTLTVDQGAHIYFHYNSGIVVYPGGRLEIRGTREHPVIMEDDRLQPAYDDAPGMWNFIWLQEGSSARLDYAVIKNATAGIIAYPPVNEQDTVLAITNSQIYNSSAYGLFAAASHVYGQNLVINNSGSSSLRVVLGGRYRFVHCTFANYRPLRSTSDAAVYVSNFYDTFDADGLPVRLVHSLEDFSLYNSIVYGIQDVEWLVEKDDGAGCTLEVAHCLIRYNDPQNRLGNDCMPGQSDFYREIILNADPAFHAPESNNLHILPESAATALGDPAVAAQVPYDLDGRPRLPDPDAGAYQHSDIQDQ